MGTSTEKVRAEGPGTTIISGVEKDGGQVCQKSKEGGLAAGMELRSRVIASKVGRRFDALPMIGLLECAQVMHDEDGSHVPGGWRRMSVEDILNHALNHIISYLSGDTSENHLSHAGCRILMAIEKDKDRRSLNLCDTCIYDFCKCDGIPIVGQRAGFDNVYACLLYVEK